MQILGQGKSTLRDPEAPEHTRVQSGHNLPGDMTLPTARGLHLGTHDTPPSRSSRHLGGLAAGFHNVFSDLGFVRLHPAGRADWQGSAACAARCARSTAQQSLGLYIPIPPNVPPPSPDPPLGPALPPVQ